MASQPAAQPAFVPGQDPTRVGGPRLVACAIDVGLGIVIYIVLFVLLSRRAPLDTFVGRASNVCAGRGVSCASFGHRYVDGPRRFLLQLVELAYLLGVFVIQRGLTGSTLGTRIMGLVTVGHDGQPIGPLRALWRSVAGIVDYLPCCLPVVGIVTIFATTGHRRVGDMAARSLVVDRHHLGSPILVPGLDTGVVTGPVGFGVPSVPPGPPAGPPGAYPPAGYAAGTAAPAATTSPPWETAPTSPTPPPPVDPTQPQWDADRGAYIQWDQVGQRWMQFDQSTQEWRPI